MDEGRIKLAEAMGWERGEVHTVVVMGRPISAQRWIDPAGNDRAPSSLPDPFTSAKDDYAVLEWMRLQSSDYTNDDGLLYETAMEFMHELDNCDLSAYQIGDYARAALTVVARQQGNDDDQK